MTTEKQTPTQRVKVLEAELKKTMTSLLKLNEVHEKEKAQVANLAYTQGYDEGFNDATQIASANQREAGIARFFRK